VRSHGSASLPRLSEKRFAQLEAELAKGPSERGWEDQRWTLIRVTTVIGRRFHLTYTIQGVRKLLVRNGWSCQCRLVERWSGTTTRSRGGSRRCGGRLAAARGAWLVLKDEAGFSMTPPHAKTWSPRGPDPVARVRRRSRRRISIAALTCYKPGHRPRLTYRPRRDDGNRGGRKSFSWRDYRDPLIAAHRQLHGPIVLVRDNLNVHKAARLREFAEARTGWPSTTYRPTQPSSTRSKASGHSCAATGSPTSPSAPQNTSSRPSGAACGTSSTAATSYTDVSKSVLRSVLHALRHVWAHHPLREAGRHQGGQLLARPRLPGSYAPFTYLGALGASVATTALFGDHADTAGLHELALFMLAGSVLLLVSTLPDPSLSARGTAPG
jgi:hypothetical protein